ncbi:MAG TPA: hypothetical protein PLY41_02865 [Acetomicrobium sp.]|nr:hypothetical protein [Acetomicrobium sp.]
MIFCATCKYYSVVEEMGTCLAPLPYWIKVDRTALDISCDGTYKTAKKCMCYTRRGKNSDVPQEEEP